MGQEQNISAEDAFDALKKWRDNLEFLLDESRFFQDLLDRYFIKLIEADRLDFAQKLIQRLNLFSSSDLEDLLIRLRESEKSLAGVGDQLDSKQRGLFMELEDSMRHVEHGFKMLKQQIFQMISGLIEIKQSDHPQK